MTAIPTLDDLAWSRLFFVVGVAIELLDDGRQELTAEDVKRGLSLRPEDRGLVVLIDGEPLLTASWAFLMHGDAASAN
jgi:hypothetical protein